MINIIISNPKDITKAIQQINKESQKKYCREINLKIIYGKKIKISKIILLSNFIGTSGLKVNTEGFGDLNFNELALLTTCSSHSGEKILADLAVVTLDCSMPITDQDLDTITKIISRKTKYLLPDLLEDLNQEEELTSEFLLENKIVDLIL